MGFQVCFALMQGLQGAGHQENVSFTFLLFHYFSYFFAKK
jgi:hypothetical protein